MRHFKRLITVPVIIIAIAVVVIAVIFFGGTTPPPQATRDWSRTPEVALENISLTQWDQAGQRLWTLTAASALQYADTTVLRDASLVLFADSAPVSSGSADRVSIDNQTSDFDLAGNITVRSHRDQTELSTQRLRWKAADRQIYSDAPVTVQRGDVLITGKGLVAEPDLSKITIYDQVTTYLEGEPQ